VISGLYTAYNGLGFDPYHLWFSAYGRTLIAKLGVGIDLVKEELSAARLRLASAALVYHITIIECTGVAAGSVSRRCIGQKRSQSQTANSKMTDSTPTLRNRPSRAVESLTWGTSQ
jgi:hypothetical protein